MPAYFPPIQALVSVAHRWVNAISGAGVASATQPATTDLSDAVAPTTWTPTDASGAGLSLTINDAHYTKVGKIVLVTFDILFPTTANTATAKIGGLPATVFNTANAQQTNHLSLDNVQASMISITALPNTSNFIINDINQSAATNANMSGGTIRGSLVYISA